MTTLNAPCHMVYGPFPRSTGAACRCDSPQGDHVPEPLRAVCTRRLGTRTSHYGVLEDTTARDSARCCVDRRGGEDAEH